MAGSKPAIIQRFMQLFRGRESHYGQWDGENTQTLKGPIPEKIWQRHVEGKGPFLGIVPVTEDNLSYFGAIDFDDNNANHAALAGIIEAAELPLVVCRSKSGGAHLFLFLRDPAPASLVAAKLRRWADALSLRNPERLVNNKKTVLPLEIFPKNAKLKPTEQGNWLNLPYYGNGTTNRYAVLSDGSQLRLEQFLEYAERQQVSATELELLEPGGVNPFVDGPPCLQTLHGLGIPEGSRNMGLFNIAIMFKLQDPGGEDWKLQVLEYNRDSGKIEPPMSDRDVKALIHSVDTRDYAYKCNELPIQPHCEKTRCKKQRWGIDAFRKKKQADAMPLVENLRIITTDPPRWLLNVEGIELDLMTDELMHIPKFRKAVMERCHRIFPLLKQSDWDDEVTKLLAEKTIIEAPEDAGTFGVFKHLVGEFLQRRRNAESRADLLRGLPFQEGPRVFFRSTDLLGFLDRKKFRDYTPGHIHTVLRQLGAGHDKFNVAGQGLQVWYLPVPDDQTEEFEARAQAQDPAM